MTDIYDCAPDTYPDEEWFENPPRNFRPIVLCALVGLAVVAVGVGIAEVWAAA